MTFVLPRIPTLAFVLTILLMPSGAAHSAIQDSRSGETDRLLMVPDGGGAVREGPLEVWREKEHVTFRLDSRDGGWMMLAVEEKIRRSVDMPTGRMSFDLHAGALTAGDPDEPPRAVSFGRMLPMEGHLHAEAPDGLLQPLERSGVEVSTGAREGARTLTLRLDEGGGNGALQPGRLYRVFVATSVHATPPTYFLSERPHESATYLVYLVRSGEGPAELAALSAAIRGAAPGNGGVFAALALGALSIVLVSMLRRRGELAPPGWGADRWWGPCLDAFFPTRRPRGASGLACALVLAALVAPGLVPNAQAQYVAGPLPPPAMGPGASCAPTQPVRHYNVTALDISIFYNRFGDVDPEGAMYVLSENVPRLLDEHRRLREALRDGAGFPTGEMDSLFVPLVLRVLEGECLEVNFTNRLSLVAPRAPVDPAELAAHAGAAHPVTAGVSDVDAPDAVLPAPVARRASIHVHGLPLDPQGSEGSATGYNPDSTVPIGGNATYRISAQWEGVYFFHDHGDVSAFGGQSLRNLHEDFVGSNTHGLFGAVVVEPAGSTWRHPSTGRATTDGWKADILVPGNRSFREFVIFYHDPQVSAFDGGPIAEPMADHGLNYRVETMSHRIFDDDEACPDFDGVENHGINPCQDPALVYSSIVHGDPATPILRAYLGEQVKIRLVHAGMEESHSHHLHNHRWNAVEDNPRSTIIDSQLLSPGETWTQSLNLGAGGEGVGKGPGDSIFHCHLFPHLYGGMWGIFRAHDAREPDLLPLPDSGVAPHERTFDHPGFPGMMVKAVFAEHNGGNFTKFNDTLAEGRKLDGSLEGNGSMRGHRPPFAPQEPGLDSRTGEVAKAPGAPYVDPCPPGTPERSYHLVAMETPMDFNGRGDHTQTGRIYALAGDEGAIVSGALDPEPAVLRTRQGECLNLLLENHLPAPEGDIRLGLTGTKVSIHSHLYAFDVLGSDGLVTGWNFDQGIWPGESIHYRFYSDEELQTVVWHDHTAGLQGVLSGLMGATLVEPEGAQWRDPANGGPIYWASAGGSGRFDTTYNATARTWSPMWRADVWGPGTPAFREFFLTIQDFMPVSNAAGVEYRPNAEPPLPFHDFGLMGFNYRSEPLAHRIGAGLDHVFDSDVHGDPATPLLEAYAGDRTVVRAHMVPYEEVHAITIQGHRWNFGWRDPSSNLVDAWAITVSEAFNAYLEGGAGGPLHAPGDYLYRAGAADDVFPGAWGIFRVHGAPAPSLLPLPGTTAPPPTALVVDPCPPGAPAETFDVHAIQKEIVYNAHGDHDMLGMMFVLAEDLDAVRRGEKAPEPLTLRVEEGSCVRIRLTNDLPEAFLANPHAQPQSTGGTRMFNLDALTTGELLLTPNDALPQVSNRTGIFAHLLLHDVRDSGGAKIGRNPDSTVGPGETRTYTYYADTARIGLALFEDMADPLAHKMHGLFGGIEVLPRGSRALDPESGRPERSAPVADVLLRNGTGWRDAVLFSQNGLALTSPDGLPVPTREDARPETVSAAAAARHALHHVTQVLGGGADARARVDLVRAVDAGWVVRLSVDGWWLRLIVDADSGELVDLQASRDARELEEGGHVRLLDDEGAPIVGQRLALTQDGEILATAVTDGLGAAMFPGIWARASLLAVHLGGTGADFLVRTDGEGRFQLGARLEARKAEDAERAAEKAADALADAGLPAGGLGVRHVDTTGSTWRVTLEDALRRYDVDLRAGDMRVLAIAFETEARPQRPSYLDDGMLARYAASYLADRFHDENLSLLQFTRDHEGAWRGDLETDAWSTTLRLDGATGRILSLLRVRADDGPDGYLTGPSETELRLRRDDGRPVFGTLVQTYHEGALTGSAVALGEGRTPVDPLLLRGAFRPWEVIIAIPEQGLQFPWDVSPDVAAYTPLEGLAGSDAVPAQVAIEIAKAFLDAHAPPESSDHRGPGPGSSPDGSRPLGLHHLLRRADGWHVGFGNARLLVDVIVDPATGAVSSLGASSFPPLDKGEADTCSGEPLEHNGPHRPPACPWSFTIADEEEQGLKAYNYRSEPLEWRLFRHPDIGRVFSSWIHGDPATPVVRAYAGDPVRVTLVAAGAKARAESFMLSGHSWPRQPDDAHVSVRQAEGGVVPGRVFRMELLGGAGGPLGLAGDYLYQGAVQRFVVEGGLWGILRVLDDRVADLRALTDPPAQQPGRDDDATGDGPEEDGGREPGPGDGEDGAPDAPAPCAAPTFAILDRRLALDVQGTWTLLADADGILHAPRDGHGGVRVRIDARNATADLDLAASARQGWIVAVVALPMRTEGVHEFCLDLRREADAVALLILDLDVTVLAPEGAVLGVIQATLPFAPPATSGASPTATPSVPGDEGLDAPAPGMLLVLVAVLVVAAARRRWRG